MKIIVAIKYEPQMNTRNRAFNFSIIARRQFLCFRDHYYLQIMHNILLMIQSYLGYIATNTFLNDLFDNTHERIDIHHLNFIYLSRVYLNISNLWKHKILMTLIFWLIC